MSANLFRNAFGLLSVLALLPSCTSSVLSKRTDEQAWIEFQKEMNLRRTPASVTEVDSPENVRQLRVMLDEVPLRKILLSCQSSSCFQSKLLLAFDETFRKSQAKNSSLSDVVYQKERDRFVKTRSHESVSAEVQSFHQLLLSGMDLRAVDHIRELNQECESKPDTAIDAYAPFSGGSVDLPKGYFACLNHHWELDANQLLDETTERLGLLIVTPEAKEWIKQKQVYPLYELTTRTILEKKKAENVKAINAAKGEWSPHLDWNLSLTAFVKKESDALRIRYPYVPVETVLTELYQEQKKTSKKGVESL